MSDKKTNNKLLVQFTSKNAEKLHHLSEHFGRPRTKIINILLTAPEPELVALIDKHMNDAETQILEDKRAIKRLRARLEHGTPEEVARIKAELGFD